MNVNHVNVEKKVHQLKLPTKPLNQFVIKNYKYYIQINQLKLQVENT